VIDYGTNAEMALVVNGNIYTGSAAAGPALEGQQIEMGMLAAPGAISDVNITREGWQCSVLDGSFEARTGDIVDPVSGILVHQGEMHRQARGITGTGVVAAIANGITSGLIRPPKILTPDKKLYLQDGFFISEDDVAEAGKAIGALRAGFLTLMKENGMWIDDVRTSYMSGATGLYVDARKAQEIGMVSPGSTRIIQFGNTSLALAKEIVQGKIGLDWLRGFAKEMRAKHCMFATSEDFKNLYSIELSLWTYGMPFSSYNDMLDIYKMEHLPSKPVEAISERRMLRDIPDLGSLGLTVLEDIGVELIADLDGCTMCQRCVQECPENALSLTEEGRTIRATIRSELCSGTACRRCDIGCPNHVFNFKRMVVRS
jgi:methylamine methyltransferase corrinoid activation protein